jgi:hypothetical protein
MIIISEYELKFNESENVFYVVTNEVIPCPLCYCALINKGRRIRVFIKTDGYRKRLKIRRLRCIACKATHHELPDIIVPYKRHCRETIEMIINGEESKTPCEINTSRRIMSWWLAVSEYITGALESLKEKLGLLAAGLLNGNLARIVRALTNSNIWPDTRLAFSRRR